MKDIDNGKTKRRQAMFATMDQIKAVQYFIHQLRDKLDHEVYQLFQFETMYDYNKRSKNNDTVLRLSFTGQVLIQSILGIINETELFNMLGSEKDYYEHKLIRTSLSKLWKFHEVVTRIVG